MKGKRVLTKGDYANYPVTQGAAESVKWMKTKIDELSSLEYKSVLDQVENRVQKTILFHTIRQKSPNDDIEILSFPMAIARACDSQFAHQK